jgi:translation elongation factor EF-1alpha
MFKVKSLEQVFYAVNNIPYSGLMCLSDAEVVQIGHITHFFSKISVAIIELTASISVGDSILIKGPTTDFEQVVDSMQIEHQNIQSAEAGQSIGLKTAQVVKEKDVVYKKL